MTASRPSIVALAILACPIAFLVTWAHGCGEVVGLAPDAGRDSLEDPREELLVQAADPDVIFGQDLALWLDADDATSLILTDGGGVARWRGRAGASEVTATHAKSAPDASLLVEKNIANGHAAVRMGGQLGIFERNMQYSVFAYPDAPFLIAVVAAYDNAASRPALLFRSGASHFAGPAMSLYGNDPYGGSSAVVADVCSLTYGRVTSPTANWNDGRFHTFGAGVEFLPNYEQAASYLRVDGVETRVAPRFTCFAGGFRTAIGGDYFHGGDAAVDVIENSLDGYVAEVIVVTHHVTTPTDLAQLSAYFQKKYGIPF